MKKKKIAIVSVIILTAILIVFIGLFATFKMLSKNSARERARAYLRENLPHMEKAKETYAGQEPRMNAWEFRFALPAESEEPSDPRSVPTIVAIYVDESSGEVVYVSSTK